MELHGIHCSALHNLQTASRLLVSQKVDFCHVEERSDEKSLNYFRDFSLRSK
jgi:hypothetical protein